MKKTTRQMSFLGYDLMVSRKHKLEKYANMPKKEKDKLQEEYISRLIQCVCEMTQKGETSGRVGIAVQPKQIYPFNKMVEDIKVKLKKDNINVENVVFFTDRVSHRIVACRIEWVKI